MLMLNGSRQIDAAAEGTFIKLERYAGFHQFCVIISPLFLSVHAGALSASQGSCWRVLS
jgi:hypothetical protein